MIHIRFCAAARMFSNGSNTTIRPLEMPTNRELHAAASLDVAMVHRVHKVTELIQNITTGRANKIADPRGLMTSDKHGESHQTQNQNRVGNDSPRRRAVAHGRAWKCKEDNSLLQRWCRICRDGRRSRREFTGPRFQCWAPTFSPK
jgi:hypothetical protein